MSGTWRRLTENVNQLAGNLTTQVRAIAEVSTAVTQGDLTRSISVEAQGEVAELKDNINQMIANLRETTTRNAQQDWLKTNLARISGMLQGQRDLAAVTQLIMSEVTPTVNAQYGAFFVAEPGAEGETELVLVASYGYHPRRSDNGARFMIGEGAGRAGGIRAQDDRAHASPRRLHQRRLRPRRSVAAGPAGDAGAVRGPGTRGDRARLDSPLLGRQPGLPRPARGNDRGRDQHDPRDDADRGAA